VTTKPVHRTQHITTGQAIGRPSVVRHLAGFLEPNYFPAVAIVAMLAITAVWTPLARMTWQGPGLVSILLAITALLAMSVYAWLRNMPKLAETALFVFFYLLFPTVGVRLSFLLTTLDRPLIDGLLLAGDRALGFDWRAYAAFVASHPIYHALTFAAYMSPIWQALACTVIFSYTRPGIRNYETLFILTFALIMTLAVYAIAPALGPLSLFGEETQSSQILRQIRAGHLTGLAYTGIVSFPSYHTVMAVVFTYANRGIRGSFHAFVILNILMLLGIPYYGDHYLVDMIGGILTASLAITVGHRLYAVPWRIKHNQSVPC
jgi:hypothetical protein